MREKQLGLREEQLGWASGGFALHNMVLDVLDDLLSLPTVCWRTMPGRRALATEKGTLEPGNGVLVCALLRALVPWLVRQETSSGTAPTL